MDGSSWRLYVHVACCILDSIEKLQSVSSLFVHSRDILHISFKQDDYGAGDARLLNQYIFRLLGSADSDHRFRASHQKKEKSAHSSQIEINERKNTEPRAGVYRCPACGGNTGDSPLTLCRNDER